MSIVTTWKQRARLIKRDVHALALACRDPRVPWYAKAVAACVVAYTFSPIDLIPDPIPVLGYLDDLILVPLGIMLTVKLIPPHVLAEHRAAAEMASGGMKPKSWIAAGIIVALWLLFALAAIAVFLRIDS